MRRAIAIFVLSLYFECPILVPHFFAGNSVPRSGKSFDVRFKADLEGGQSGDSTLGASIPDEACTAPKTYLPMRLANLQTTYHDLLVNKADDSSLPTADADDEARAQNAKAEVLMEVNPNFERSHVVRYTDPQPLSWPERLWIQLQMLFGKALWCIKRKAAASKESTFSKSLSKTDASTLNSGTSLQGRFNKFDEPSPVT